MSLAIPGNTEVVYVSASDGSDSTGNGAFNAPFATIAHALTTITDAAANKRYVIKVSAGTYNTALVLKYYVWIHGDGPEIIQIGGAISFDASWSGNADLQAGFDNVVFTATPTFDFSSVTSNNGKLFFNDTRFLGSATFVAASSLNQVTFENCNLLGGYTQHGIDMYFVNTSVGNARTIYLYSSSVSTTNLTATGGGTNGNVLLATNPGDLAMASNLSGFGLGGGVTLNGTNLQFNSNTQPLTVDLVNGAPSPVFGGGRYTKVTDVNISSYNVQTSDYLLQDRYTTTGASSINLPSIAAVGGGRTIIVTDSGYNVTGHNITIVRNGSDTINNVAGNYVVNTPNGVTVTLVSNALSNNWEID